MRAPERILIIRPSALGDVCRSVPIAASLKAHWPDSEIDWLVNAPFADAVRSHPAVSRAVPFDRRGISRALTRLDPNPLRRFARTLRDRRYDIVIDAQGLARSGVSAWLTRAPIRVGHRDAREGGWLPLTHRVCANASPHTVDRMLTLLGPLGVPVVHDLTLHTPSEARESVANDAELGDGPIVLAPTSLWPGKQWPIARFAQLAARLHERGLGPIVVVGGPGERDQCTPLLEGDTPVVDRVGRTSVGELMAVIERSRLVVANDSASLHIAVGFARPIVALFGPTDTARVGPYRREADVIQHTEPGDALTHKDHQSGRAMMERISVDEVEQASLDRL